MALTITVIDKATHAATTVNGGEVTLSALSVVELPIPHIQIKSLARQGNDLLVTTVDGQVITIHGFYVDEQNGQAGHNDLVLEDNGGLWAANANDLSALPSGSSIDPALVTEGGSNAFAPVESIDSLLDPVAATAAAGESPTWLPPAYALAGFATALTAAALLNTGPTTSSQPGNVRVTTNPADGSVTVTGTGKKGSTIDVTFPDGSKDQVKVGNDGTFTSNASPPHQPSGKVDVTQTTPGNDPSPPKEVIYTQLPTIDKIAVNPDGTITVSGHTDQPNGKIKVVLPDGTSVTGAADGNGNYAVKTDKPVSQNSGDINVTASDSNGKGESQPVDALYSKPTVTDKTDGSGNIAVSGETVPGGSVKVTFPDGSTKTVTADGNGKYTVDSVLPQPSDTVEVKVSDPSTGKTSPPIDVPYHDVLAPNPPILNAPTTDANGNLVVTGTTEQKSTVEVTFPDGTKKPATVNDNGTFTVTSASPQTGGTVSAVATDQSGNHSSPPAVEQWNPVTGAATLTQVVTDSGADPSDFITNDTHLVFIGNMGVQMPAGGSVQISLDGGTTWKDVTLNGTTGNGNTWGFDNSLGAPGSAPTAMVPDGDYTVKVQVKDSAGHVVDTSQQVVKIDTIAPTNATTISTADSGSAQISGTFTGSLADGSAPGVSKEYVEVSTDGGTTWHPATVNGNNWTYVPDTPLANGTYTVEARVTDMAGCGGTVTTQSIKITDGPTAITLGSVVTDTVPSGSEADFPYAGSDFITSDTTLTFLGTLGAALTSGQKAKISFDGGQNWTDITAINTNPTAGGSSANTWSYDTGATPLHQGDYAVQVKVVDSSNALVGQLVSQKLVVDTTKPTESIKITGMFTDTPPVGDWSTDDTTLVFVGTVGGVLANGTQAGVSREFVQVSFDNGQTWHIAAVSDNGTTWSYDNRDHPFPKGKISLDVRVVDLAGNVGNTDHQDVTITKDPTITIAKVAVDSYGDWDNANSPTATDFITNPNLTRGNGTLVLSGALKDPIASGQTVEVSTDGGKTWSAAAASGSAWSYTLPSSLSNTDGIYKVEARLKDGTGQIGDLAAQQLMVDTTKPIEHSTVTGLIGKDGPITGWTTPVNDQALSITGQLDQPLNKNGGSQELVQISITSTDPNMPSSWATEHWLTAPSGPLTWLFDNTSVKLDGSATGIKYTINTRVVDIAGNIGPLGSPQEITVMGGPGTEHLKIVSMTPDNMIGTMGSSGAYGTDKDFITNLKGATSIKFTGTYGRELTADESVQISLDGGKTWLTDTGLTWSNLTWNYTTSNIASLTDKTFTVEARIISNTTLANDLPTQEVTVDTKAPDQTFTAIKVGSGAGVDITQNNSSASISETKPVFSGTLDSALATTTANGVSAETVQVSTDGGTTWNNATVNGSSWTYTPNADLSGTFIAKFRVVDKAGNIDPHTVDSTVTITPPTGYGVSVDSVSPDTAVTQDGTRTGTVVYGAGNDLVTNPVLYSSSDPFTLSGKVTKDGTGAGVPAGGKLQINIDGKGWQDVTVGSNGSWSFNLAPLNLKDGSHSLQAQILDSGGKVVLDAAGDPVGLPSTQSPLVIDTVKPTETISITSAGDDTTGGGTNHYTTSDSTKQTISGTLSGPLLNSDSTGVSQEALLIKVDNGNWQQVTVTGSSWSYTPTLAAGTSHTIQLEVVDKAGNVNTDHILNATFTVPGDPKALQITQISPDTWVSDGNYGSATDFITSLNTSAGHSLTVYGKLGVPLNTGDQLQVSTDGGQTWSSSAITPSSTGDWSYTLPSTLPDGSYTLQARVHTAAGGDVLTATAPHPLVIDSSAPAQIAAMTDVKGVTSADTVELNTLPGVGPGHWIVGKDQPDGSYSYTLSGTLDKALVTTASGGVTTEQLQVGWANALDGVWTWKSATIDTNGTQWSCPVSLLLSGGSAVYDVKLRVVDLAGNIKEESGAYELTQGIGGSFIDTPAPDLSVVLAPDLSVVPAPNSTVLALPVLAAPDLAAVSIPAPPYDDAGAMFRNSHSPSLHVALNRPLQTGFYVELTLIAPNGTPISYSSKTSPASFVFMGQNFTFTPPKTLSDATYDVAVAIYSSTGIQQFTMGGKLLVDTVAPTETAALTAISSDTGIDPSDFITNNPNQTFSGTLTQPLSTGKDSGVAHEVLMVDLINNSSGQSVLGGPKVATDNGAMWSFAPGFALYDGSYTVKLQVKDAAGNTSQLVADSKTVVIDTIAPNGAQLNSVGGNWFTLSSSDSGTGVNGLFTSGTHLKFSGSYTGSLADGTQSGISVERIEVNVGDGTGWHKATVDPTAKTWTLDYSGTTLQQSSYDVQVRMADAAGNATSSLSNANPVKIITDKPTETATISTINPDTNSTGSGHPAVGTSNDFITYTTSNGGKLTISGSTSAANPNNGDKVQVSFDGGQHWADAAWSGSGWTYNTATASSDPSGYNGEGTYKAADVQVRVVNIVGTAGTSKVSPHDIVVDNTAPAQTAALTQITDSSGNNAVKDPASGAYIIASEDGLTFKGTLTNALSASGNGVSKETLWINLGDGHGWQQVNVTGKDWSFANPNSLPDNSNSSTPYQFQLQVVDEAGNLGNIPTDGGSVGKIIVATTPTETPTIKSISPDTWVSDGGSFGTGSDFITSTKLNGASGALTVTGDLDAALKSGETVQVRLVDGTHNTSWVTATTNGTNWSASIPSVNDGVYTIQAIVKNAAGGATDPVTHPLVVDNTAPTQSASLVNVAGDKVQALGVPGAWTIDYDGTYSCTLSGTLSGALATASGSVTAEQLQVGVQLYGTSSWTWQAATVTPDGKGGYTWTCPVSVVMATTTPQYQVELRVVDLAGNVKTETGSYDLYQYNAAHWLDSIPAPVFAPVLALNSMMAFPAAVSALALPIPAPDYADADYMIRSNNDPKLYVKLDRPLPTDGYVTIGVMVDGVNYTYESSNVATAQFDMSRVAQWPPIVGYKPSYTLADGTYELEVVVYNSNGTPSGAPNYGHLLIDTVAPTGEATLASLSNDTGISPSDFITQDPHQTLTGALTAQLADGSGSGISHEMVKIDVLGSNGQSVIGGPVTADNADLAWSYALPSLADGTYTVQSWTADAAGHDNKATAKTSTIVIDTVAPTQVAGIVSIQGPDGTQTSGFETTATTGLTFKGTLDHPLADGSANGVSAELVQVSIDGGAWQTVTDVDPVTGQWSYTDAGTLQRGSHTVSVRVVDKAGNVDLNVPADIAINVIEPPPPPPIDNPAVRTYTIGSKYGGLGYSMSAIRDFNGDGYADYIVSAPRAHYGNTCYPGQSTMYLLYGSANGLPNISNLDNLTAAQGIKIASTSKFGLGLQGMTVSDIGDFNGDGRSDVAISSNLNNTTYVLFGQAGNAIQTLDLNKLTASQGFAVEAACWAPASSMGADVNGDGYSDLIISNLDCGGKDYVIYGHAGTQGKITYTGSTVKGAAAGYTTESGTNGLGTVLSAVGDVNGDGYADFIATMPGNVLSGGKQPGSAYLVFGGPNGVSQPNTTLVNMDKVGSGKITISASNAYEHLGGQAGYGENNLNADAYRAEFHSVASLGNIDGSGRGAFAIGSPGASPNNGTTTTAYTYGSVSEGAGAVYVLYGGTNWSNITLPSWNSVTKSWSGGSLNGTNGFVIYSSSFANAANGKLAGASDLGFSVGSAGDVNGDGISDFLIGAPAAYGGKGAVFLVFGTPGGLPGANSGAVDLDALVAAGKASAFGVAGTAVEYIGTQPLTNASQGGSNMGTDVTGGDFSGTGIHGYAFSSWGQTIDGVVQGTSSGNVPCPVVTTGVTQAGEVYVYNGTTAFLTQLVSSNASGHVYYAGDNNIGAAPLKAGVDLIATGAGQTNWVHGIGTDTTGTTSTTVQHDAVNGGVGNDYIGIIGTTFTSVNGGAGWNTLVFEQSGMKVDLAQMGLRVQGFGQFDLNNQSNTAASDPKGLFTDATTGNTLALRLSDVLSESNGTVGLNGKHMTILGDATSTVQLDGSAMLAATNWAVTGQQTVGGVTFDVYHNTTMGTSTAADLLIQQGVHVI